MPWFCRCVCRASRWLLRITYKWKTWFSSVGFLVFSVEFVGCLIRGLSMPSAYVAAICWRRAVSASRCFSLTRSMAAWISSRRLFVPW